MVHFKLIKYSIILKNEQSIKASFQSILSCRFLLSRYLFGSITLVFLVLRETSIIACLFSFLEGLQIEVEAKVAKAISGVKGNDDYEKTFFDNPIVREYAKTINANQKISASLDISFQMEVENFAYKVFDVYKDHFGDTPQNNPANYKANESLDYFNSLFKPDVEEPITVTPSNN